jgi:hypothetical protein
MSNGGLLLLAAGFALAPHLGRRAVALLASGAALSAAGGFAFIVNLWRTLDGPPAHVALRRRGEAPDGSHGGSPTPAAEAP